MKNFFEHIFRIYARAIIFDASKKRVLLIKKNANQKIGPGAWLLPGGTVEFGEDIEISLIREIQEETNLKILSLELLATKKMVIQETHWLGLYYLGEVSSEDDVKNLETEKHETVQFIALQDVPDLRDYTVLQFVKNIRSNREHFDVHMCDPKSHSMGSSFERYVAAKMHHLIRINYESFSRVRVIGSYDRSVHVSKDEKNDKPFNFKRPTAFLDGDILYVCCFPGYDYVRHYANLIATYLQNIGAKKTVSFINTDDDEILNVFASTNIRSIPDADIILYGNIDRIGIFEEKTFEGGGDFLWKQGVIGSKRVLLLGCKFSIWGDAGYFLIRSLAQFHSFGTFIYIGKLGSLEQQRAPNQHIATGSRSFLDEKWFEWNNIFQKEVKAHDTVIEGDHVTCASVVDETKAKVVEFQKRGIFIDPEIGHMARACTETGRQFSYLHIISDNVADPSIENLSNERDFGIPEKRNRLFREIGTIIEKSVSE